MDVTKVNFDLVADEFISLLQDCEFYTVDQEMTGITIKGNDDNFGMTLEESYLAKKPVAEHFLAFQLGICLFTKKNTAAVSGEGEAAPAYDVRPFNFWLRAGAEGPDVAMSMDALNFHVRNKLSLQKWMNEGINYVDCVKEDAERAKLFPTNPAVQSLTDEEKEWVRKQMDSIRTSAAETKVKVAEWHEEKKQMEEAVDEAKNATEKDDDAAPIAKTEAGADVEETKISEKKVLPSLAEVSSFKTVEVPHVSCKADVALHFALENAGLFLIAEPSLDGGCPVWRRLQTTYNVVTPEAYNAKKAEDIAKREVILGRRIGFRKVWNALEACGKTHIGHNYFTDILFFMQIHNQQLASTLEEHRARTHKAFPSLMDTKILLTSLTPEMNPFSKTALEPACDESEKRVAKLPQGKAPIFNLPLGFERYHKSARKAADACNSDATCAHHAAYDAYMTGILFLNMRALYGVQWENKWENHVAVFGSCYVWQTDKHMDRPAYAHGVPFHIQFPPHLRRPDVEYLLLCPDDVEKYHAIEATIKEAKLSGKKDQPLPRGMDTGMYFGWLGDAEAVVATKISNLSADEILARVVVNKSKLPQDAPQQQVVFTQLEQWKSRDERPTKRQRLE